VNDLLEAKHNNELNRMVQRWLRYELIVLDELGYVAMPEAAAECLFQVIAGRAETAAVIVTSNLPFSEMDHDVSERPLMQGHAGPANGSGAHH
jgi:DNA replication protein DnaC